MSKRDRPWSKSGRGPPPIDTNKSDRFYLNGTLFDETDAQRQQQQQQHSCQCGSKNPPPLFHRSALVRSCGKLKAAILGTYSFEPAALVQEFPSLFGPTATTPCLVLHGKKGWTQETKKGEVDEEPESAPRDEEDSLIDDDATVGTQEEATLEDSKRFEAFTPSPQRRKYNRPQFPGTVHFSEIAPSWLPPRDIPTLFSAAIDMETGALQQSVLDKRLFKRGVHHPKFMILIEESGSLVVVVSTANLTRALTTDASWVQRFPPAVVVAVTSATSSSSNGTTTTIPRNDFGSVLANFLQCEMLATAAGQVTAHWFVREYLKWKSVVDLERSYDYREAQVHLVATVPGEYERDSYKSLQQDAIENRGFLYGQERVADLVGRLALPSLQTDQDRLIFQPTSFGGNWNLRNMSELVRSYLGERRSSGIHDHAVLERLDIVWPTEYFVNIASQMLKGRDSPSSVSDDNRELSFSIDAGDDSDTRLATEKANGGFLFLSSETFNKIDLACLSRMVMFEPSVPAQRPLTLTPHFKSVARLFKGSDYRIRKDFSVAKCEEYFSWFLLTSACLSRGAQGEAVAGCVPENETVSYSNFEIGVLFCSILGPRAGSSKDRIYCWQPSQCSCTRPSIGPRLIHLPSPYYFRPARYVEDEDEGLFCETPYFHEVPIGTGCVGNMQLTPYGAALAAQFATEEPI